MVKLKIELKVRKYDDNNELEEEVTNQEIIIFTDEDAELYEKLKMWDQTIIERVNTLEKMKMKEKICIACTASMDKYEEKEKLEKIGKPLDYLCYVCEQEKEQIIERSNNLEIEKYESNVLIRDEQMTNNRNNIPMEDSISEENSKEDINKVKETKKNYGRKRNEKKVKKQQGNSKKHTKAYEKLMEELTIPQKKIIIIKDDDDEKIEPSLAKILRCAIKGDRNSINLWYNCGKRFREEIETKIGKGEKEQNVRKKIYNELAKKMPELKRDMIQYKLIRAERVYKLFKAIGREKINRLQNCCITDIMECKKEEIDEIIEYFGNNIDIDRNCVSQIRPISNSSTIDLITRITTPQITNNAFEDNFFNGITFL
ncbi:hypothetical protein RclHR1_11700003 [Rhizophagus clarus]|uniref:Uncharacterized protein n=1 Tax=Rhizophagus clarus TaxID=94130 RepID=A0A2Z6Q4T7_9GLOM|nr:hypothetical protein RclHR1_11700003 [Rhizophagus clarus]GES95448.1 hypothetical protein GLOIN_2v1811349 [Rhizophagus clarus]